VAARLLEADEADLEVVDSQCRVRGAPGRGLSFAALAQESLRGQNLPDGMEPELEARFTYNPENWTFPYGVHIAAVEVARDTGRVHLLGYWVAHDCGTMLNPMLVDGQLHGGLAQGIGGALSEELRYDAAGQLLSRTFMDYAIPTAETMPPITIGHIETPSPHTPGGMKGMAEGGTIGAPATIANAVADALAGARGVCRTGGDINLAILNFKNDTAAGSERGKNFSGIHHIGFQVESLEAVAERLTAAGSRRRHDVEEALGVRPGREGNVEVKWTGPDGIMLDRSKTGWLGTPT